MITVDTDIAGLLIGIVGSVLMLLALAQVDTKRDMEHYKEKSCALSRELWTFLPQNLSLLHSFHPRNRHHHLL